MQSLPFSPTISSSQTLIKGVSQLYGRLFDHHAVLQSEANHTKQFDGVLGSSEYATKVLSDELQQTSDVLDECVKGFSILPDISSSLILAKQKTDTILMNAGTHQKGELLKAGRELRDIQWREFTSGLTNKIAEIDAKYDQEAEAVRQQYQEAESKLS